MIEINLLKQGHGILYKQKNIAKNVAHRRRKILLLLILLLSSLIVYFTPTKTSNLNSFLARKLLNHLDIVWFEESSSSFETRIEENVFPLKDQTFIQKLTGYVSGLAGDIFPKEEIFYVEVASTLSPEEAEAVQKNLFSKGFQSDRETYRELADKFFVVLDPTQTQESADDVFDKISTPNVTWEIQISGNKGTEIKSQSFFSYEEAEQIRKQIQKKGLKGKITKKKLPAIFHVVRAGKFKNREQALHLLNQLQKAGLEGTIVKR